MLRLENFSAGYRGDKPVIKNINIEFDNKTLLLGPNGAGKTTLFRALCGLTPKISGKAYVNGEDLDNVYGRPKFLVTNIPEIFNLIHSDAYRVLEVYLDILGGDINRALRILDDFGIKEKFLKKNKINHMSSGQRKIFFNSIALAIDAKVKLFDEPFEQLDPAKKNILINYLERDNSLLILSTHETWLIEKLTRWDAVFMFDGMIFGKVLAKDLLGLYLVYEEVPDAVLTVKTKDFVFSLIKEPRGKKIEDFMSLDYVYKLA